MTELSLALMLLFAPAAPVAPMVCAIHASRGTTAAGLLAMVNVAYADALRTAQDFVHAPPAILGDGFLEIQHGCLVYAFDVRTPHAPGEVWVDAGSGRVLDIPVRKPARAGPADPNGASGPPRAR